MSEKVTTLIWKGIWEISESSVSYDITDQSGVYMVLTGNKESILRRWKLLDSVIYIGGSKNIRKGLRDQGNWKKWTKHQKNSLIIKLATVEDPSQLEALTYCLTQKMIPLCNTILEDTPSQPATDTLIIKNKGQKWPLPEMCKCDLPIPKPEEKNPSSDAGRSTEWSLGADAEII